MLPPFETTPPVFGLLPKFTTEEEMKFVPVRVSATLWPRRPLVGEIEARVGTGFDELEIVKAKFGVVPPPGAGFVTVTLAVPEVAMSDASMEALIWVALTKVVVRADPLKFTTEEEMNPEPFTVKVKAGPPAVAEDGLSEVMLGTGLLPAPPPGAPRFAASSSMTSTQSLPLGAVKVCEPLFGNVPISVATPVRGAYHHAIAVEDEETIDDMLIVLVVAFPSEK